MRKQQTRRLILARETIGDLSHLGSVQGATHGTITCTLNSVLPACTDYCPGPITSLGRGQRVVFAASDRGGGRRERETWKRPGPYREDRARSSSGDLPLLGAPRGAGLHLDSIALRLRPAGLRAGADAHRPRRRLAVTLPRFCSPVPSRLGPSAIVIRLFLFLYSAVAFRNLRR